MQIKCICLLLLTLELLQDTLKGFGGKRCGLRDKKERMITGGPSIQNLWLSVISKPVPEGPIWPTRSPFQTWLGSFLSPGKALSCLLQPQKALKVLLEVLEMQFFFFFFFCKKLKMPFYGPPEDPQSPSETKGSHARPSQASQSLPDVGDGPHPLIQLSMGFSIWSSVQIFV